MVKWMLNVVFEENLVSDIGRACFIEIRCKSRWWSRCRHICSKFGLFELVNLIWLRKVSLNGMVKLGMNVNVEFWKKHIRNRIREVGKQVWKNGFNDTEREKEYVQIKECPRNESFADGNVGSRYETDDEGRLFTSERMAWKYEDDKCSCGLLEKEKHVLFQCTLYGEERGRWRGAVRDLKRWYGGIRNNKRVPCEK